MKKKLLFYFLALSFTVNAQYSNILSFNFTKGASPYGNLVFSKGVLYGMTFDGGANGRGCIFSIDTNGSGYRDLHDFNGASGGQPTGSLTLSGSKLFGMTWLDGLHDSGCVFSIDTSGNVYRDIFNFNGINGANPYGSLTVSGNKLYGMTENGGAHFKGCIFSVDTNGNGYKDILDFNGTDGAKPLGALTLSLSGSVLYGMAELGGLHNYGCLFSIDTNGNRYKDLLDFDGLNNGASPFGSLTLSGKALFGMAQSGGASGHGNIFSIDTNGTGYKELFSFNNTDGAFPLGSLALSGNMLYGMTSQGGASDSGCLFTIDTNGMNYTKLLDFNNTLGYAPNGSLTIFGKVMYGMTKNGGTGGDGVIFSFKDTNITNSITELTFSPEAMILYPNPNNGRFTVSLQGVSEKAQITVFNVMGEQVYQSALNGTNTPIEIDSKANGIYLYRIIKETGGLVSEGRFIIQ